jgi:hypothetical protein
MRVGRIRRIARLLPYLDHLQNPLPAGALLEVRLQRNSAVVIN